MRRFPLIVLVFIVTSLVAVGAPAQSQSGYDLVEQCRARGGAEAMCKGLWQLLRIPGGLCRDAASDDPNCAFFDGISIEEALVKAHEHSWLAEALRLQRGLDDAYPLEEELWTHTHNSYNADAYPLQFAGGLDRNQIYSITDQLRMGTRAIELDLHWAPHITTGKERAVQVCHGNESIVPPPPTGRVHLGCELNSPLFVTHLEEIRKWLDAHTDEVVLVYLENALDDLKPAHDEAAAAIEDVLGDVVYRTNTTCATLPIDISRQDIRDAGAQVILTGDCKTGHKTWGSVVHERGSRWHEGGLDEGNDFPAYPCVAERAKDRYETDWVRHWGDETGLSASTGGGGDVTPTDALNMTRCGVNMFGPDNLVPFDERVVNVVWSWRVDEPSTTKTGFCAVNGSDGRFYASHCRNHRQYWPSFACYDGTDWAVTARKGRFVKGEQACIHEGLGEFSVPWNGYENERLKEAKPAGVTDVWVNYSTIDGRWVS